MMKIKIFLFLSVVFYGIVFSACNGRKSARIGVYYFDGWSGNSSRTGPGRSWEKGMFAKSWNALEEAGHVINSWENEPWAKNAPTHLTKRMVEEFQGREPLWGWRNDTQEIMERQIDLAADHGIDFFTFCWYWRDNGGSINPEAIENLPQNSSLQRYMAAENKHKLKYALLIVNASASSAGEIRGVENWRDGVKYWAKYFKDSQYVTVDGKPLVIIYDTDNGITEDELAAMQEIAKKEGFKKGLAIAGCGHGEGSKTKSGFTHRTHYTLQFGYSSGSEEHKFEELYEATKKLWTGSEERPYIPMLTVGWDKRPWEGSEGLGQPEGWYYANCSPELFKTFLKDGIQWMDDNPEKTTKERLLIIYAWNELGEGGYLVPTRDDPDAAKLKIIKKVLQEK